MKTTKKQKIEQLKQLRDRQIKEILQSDSRFSFYKAYLINEARHLCNMAVYEVKNDLL